jgi:hypothetical protein
MNQALVADVAVPVSREAAMTGQPEKGHYIAVMVSATTWLTIDKELRPHCFPMH